ncbi:MAG TPA: condensation domain-containing protein, partial [Thermoanaerobaculia bacterium]|nr:condensation domain-containing protein [Thermoanaerobaculia bacterium]
MSVASRISSLSPEQRALFELLKKKSKAAAPKVHQPPPVVRHSGPTGEGDWPLSMDQERLWFMHQLAPESTAFNIDAASRLRGALHLPSLHGALNEIVRRHAAWRTTFAEVDGRPVQRVIPRRAQNLSIVDLSGLPADRREPTATRLLAEGTRELFDLERGPLVRIRLLRLDAEDHICLMTVHHLVIDWISFQIVWTELAAFYDAGLTGRPAAVPEPPVHYSDYAVWQREWLSGEVLDDLVEHWRRRLDGFPQVLELPTDRPRPPVQRMHGGSVDLDTGRAWMEGLRGLSRREGATSFMGFLALTYALLHRFSGQEKMILGSNNANRNRPEVEPVIGYFLTQVPFAVDLSGDPPFRELLGRVRQAALDAYAHQDLTFGLLVQALQPPRDTSRPPLIQTLVLVLDGQYNENDLTGLAGEAVNVLDANARYDLMFGVYEQEDTIQGPIEYDADLFDHSTAERLIEVFVRMGEAVISDPTIRLSQLPTLSDAARHQVLREWNDTATPPALWTVPALFAELAALTPDAPALVFAGETVTYDALDAHAKSLARRLDLVPESRVAILLERTPALPAALLAVWRAGGACVPLDPTSPLDRLRALLTDAAPVAVIHDGTLPAGILP